MLQPSLEWFTYNLQLYCLPILLNSADFLAGQTWSEKAIKEKKKGSFVQTYAHGKIELTKSTPMVLI